MLEAPTPSEELSALVDCAEELVELDDVVMVGNTA